MDCYKILFVSVVQVLLLTISQSNSAEVQFKLEGKSDKHVLDYLLDSERYDKRLLPPTAYGPSIVNITVVLFTLSSPDESSLKYDIEFLLQQEWYDSRLQFINQTSSFNSLNGIHHQGDIWLPDTNFHMHGDFKPTTRPVRFTLNVYKDGRVEYTTRRHLSLNCEGSMNIFPFDLPVCTFAMESISYEKSDLKYVWKDDNYVRKSSYLKSSNAYLERNRTYECGSTGSWRGNYSCLQVEMIFSRDRTFYFATIFIPGLILVTSSFITFFLEWDAVPARTIIGVTTMLNYFTTSNSFRRTLPDVANLTAMNVWDGVCMCFVFASFVEFVIVNSVGRRKVKSNTSCSVGNGTISKKIIKEPKCLECAQNVCSHSLLIDVLPKVNEKCSKPTDQVRLARTIDTVARLTFPSAFVMFLAFFFFYYSVNATNRGIYVGVN